MPPELAISNGRVVTSEAGVTTSTPAAQILELADDARSRSNVGGRRFHRTVLPLVLELGAQGSVIHPTACAVDGSQRIPVHPDDDHVLSGADWFPVDRTDLGSIKGWIQSNTPVGLEAYVGLYRGLAPTFEFVDLLSEEDLAGLVGTREPSALGLAATLYDYQRTGVAWLRAHSDLAIGGILADEMGLGKTIQALGLLLHEKQKTRRPSLVIMPLTLLENWRREILKFAPGLRFYRHIGASRARSPAAIEGVDVVLTTYETVVSDVGMLSMIGWNVMLTDEAQAFKNPETQRARALSKIPRRVAFAVTGTPLENHALDLWSIASIAEPGFLGTRAHFDAVLNENPSLLRAAVRPLMLRREVADVAKDLPERIDIDVALEMFGPEAAAYDSLIDRVKSDRKPALTLITRLRQFTTHPRLTGSFLDAPPSASSAKLARLLEIVEEIHQSGQKVIIFAAFLAGNDLLSHQLSSRFDMPVWVLDGRTQHDQRQSVLDDYATHRGSAALIMNSVVGGVGLNITAASHVIHYSLEWNPAKEDQATARAWRRGQQLPVTIHRLFYVGTIDEAIVERVAEKRKLFDQVVEAVDIESETDLSSLLASALRRWKS